MRTATTILLLAITWGVSAQTFSTPFLGQVTGVRGGPLALRVSPPELQGGGYALGSYVCSAYPGTTFYATERTQLVSGETWYWVQVATPATPANAASTACGANVTGWMVGQLRTGRSVIAVTAPEATPPVGVAKEGRERSPPPDFKPETSWTGQLSPWKAYPLLVLGTLVSVIVLTWERNRNVTRRVLAKSLTMFEFVTLAIANSIALGVLAPAYRQTDPNAWGAKMLQHLTGTGGGHFLLGFILTIIIMKSVSFAAPQNSSD